MRILITNDSLDRVSGTVAYVKDLALGLQKRGHQVCVYSHLIGQMGRELKSLGIAVVFSLKKVPFTPQIIHGHHTLETLEAVHYFAQTPALYMCHDRTAIHDCPPKVGAIAKYIAVDENCLERILLEKIPREKTGVIYNFVNLERFKPRCLLPKRPERAVVFSNYASHQNYLPTIRNACQKMGISLEVIGAGLGQYTDQPERILGKSDLVFGKAKCALEAMAVGCAVICCDFRGLGGMVTRERFDQFRKYNFGMKILSQPIVEKAICREIERYDANEAGEISQRVRAEASLELFLDQIERLYQEVSLFSRPPDFSSQETAEFVSLRRQRRARTMVRKLMTQFPWVRDWYLRGKALFSSAF